MSIAFDNFGREWRMVDGRLVRVEQPPQELTVSDQVQAAIHAHIRRVRAEAAAARTRMTDEAFREYLVGREPLPEADPVVETTVPVPPLPEPPARNYQITQDSVGLQTFVMARPSRGLAAMGGVGSLLNSDGISLMGMGQFPLHHGTTIGVFENLSAGLFRFTGMKPYKDEFGIKRMVIPTGGTTQTQAPRRFLGVAWDRLFEVIRERDRGRTLSREALLQALVSPDRAIAATALELWLRNPTDPELTDWMSTHPIDVRNMIGLLTWPVGGNLYCLEAKDLGISKMVDPELGRIVHVPFAVRRSDLFEWIGGGSSACVRGGDVRVDWSGHTANAGGSRNICTGSSSFDGAKTSPTQWAPGTVLLQAGLGTAELITWKPEPDFQVEAAVRAQYLQAAIDRNEQMEPLSTLKSAEGAGNAAAVSLMYHLGVHVCTRVLRRRPDAAFHCVLEGRRLYQVKSMNDWMTKGELAVAGATNSGEWWDYAGQPEALAHADWINRDHWRALEVI